MSIEKRSREAAEGLWAGTIAAPEESLAALLDTATRHRHRSRIRLAVAAAVALLAGWGLATLGHHPGASPSPSKKPSGVQSTSVPCSTLYVTCLGDRDYVFALNRPLTWHIPAGYNVSAGSSPSDNIVQTQGLGRWSDSGVTVLEHVRAASSSYTARLSVPDSAYDFATWLAARPSLEATSPQVVEVDGHTAWRVRVRLKPHVGPLEARCTVPADQPCYPVTFQAFLPFRVEPGYDGSATTGVSPGMVAEYTVFDVGGHTALVWSWAADNDSAALDHNRPLIDGLSFS